MEFKLRTKGGDVSIPSWLQFYFDLGRAGGRMLDHGEQFMAVAIVPDRAFISPVFCFGLVLHRAIGAQIPGAKDLLPALTVNSNCLFYNDREKSFSVVNISSIQSNLIEFQTARPATKRSISVTRSAELSPVNASVDQLPSRTLFAERVLADLLPPLCFREYYLRPDGVCELVTVRKSFLDECAALEVVTPSGASNLAEILDVGATIRGKICQRIKVSSPVEESFEGSFGRMNVINGSSAFLKAGYIARRKPTFVFLSPTDEQFSAAVEQCESLVDFIPSSISQTISRLSLPPCVEIALYARGKNADL